MSQDRLRYYSIDNIVMKLKHWHKVYDSKQAVLHFKKGSAEDLKYIKMKCDQQIRLLQRIGLVNDGN